MRNGERTFIRIPSWEKYQHYKDRDAPWIKTYTRLLHDDDWLTLTAHRRGVLLGIWLLYASGNGRVTADHVRLSHQLEVRVTPADVAALNHAGFIEIVASTHKDSTGAEVVHSRAPAPSQEAEAETEEEQPEGSDVSLSINPTPNPEEPQTNSDSSTNATTNGRPETYEENQWRRAMENGAGWSRDYQQPTRLEPDLLLPTRQPEGEGI